MGYLRCYISRKHDLLSGRRGLDYNVARQRWLLLLGLGGRARALGITATDRRCGAVTTERLYARMMLLLVKWRREVDRLLALRPEGWLL